MVPAWAICYSYQQASSVVKTRPFSDLSTHKQMPKVSQLKLGQWSVGTVGTVGHGCTAKRRTVELAYFLMISFWDIPPENERKSPEKGVIPKEIVLQPSYFMDM